MSQSLAVKSTYHRADVVVALSAGLIENCNPPSELIARELYAANLVQKGYSRSHKLIITGQYTNGQKVSLSACRRKLAKRFGIRAQNLVIDNEARSTLDNAINTKRLMRSHQWRDAVVVTVDNHMKRAIAVFRKQNIRAYPVTVADHPIQDGHWFSWMRVELLHRFLYEYGALLFYKCYGYL